MLLRARLFDLLSSLPLSDKDRHRTVRVLLLYLMGRRNAADVRRLSNQLGITEQIYGLKSEYLDRNAYTISQFWRASFAYFRSMPRPESTNLDRAALLSAIESVPTIAAQVRDDCLQDLLLMEDFLCLDDHVTLSHLAYRSEHSTPTDTDLLPVVKKLQRYCQGLAYNKMRFITKNDAGLSLDDMASELFEAGIRTLREYDADYSNELKLLNTAKVGAKNHCFRLIDFHTTHKRSRIVRIGQVAPAHAQQRCGTCAWFDAKDSTGKSCKDKGAKASHQPCRVGTAYHARTITSQEVCGNCSHYEKPLDGAKKSCVNINVGPGESVCQFFDPYISEGPREYMPTTSSLDQEIYNDSNGAVTLLDKQVDNKARHDDRLHSQQWLTDLLGRVDGNIGRVVRIVLGDNDIEFERWLWKRSGKSYEDVSETALAKFACEFTSVPIREVRVALRRTGALESRRHVS